MQRPTEVSREEHDDRARSLAAAALLCLLFLAYGSIAAACGLALGLDRDNVAAGFLFVFTTVAAGVVLGIACVLAWCRRAGEKEGAR